MKIFKYFFFIFYIIFFYQNSFASDVLNIEWGMSKKDIIKIEKAKPSFGFCDIIGYEKVFLGKKSIFTYSFSNNKLKSVFIVVEDNYKHIDELKLLYEKVFSEIKQKYQHIKKESFANEKTYVMIGNSFEEKKPEFHIVYLDRIVFEKEQKEAQQKNKKDLESL